MTKPPPFFLPRMGVLRGGQLHQESSNTAYFVSFMHSEGRDVCLDCERIPHRDHDGRSGWCLQGLRFFSHQQHQQVSFPTLTYLKQGNVLLWSGELQKGEIFILQNPIGKITVNILTKNDLKHHGILRC